MKSENSHSHHLCSLQLHRSNPAEVFLGKGLLKICSKFTGEHRSCSSAISVKLQSNFLEITLRHGCSPVNLLHVFRTSFRKNTFEGLLLKVTLCKIVSVTNFYCSLFFSF